MDTDPDLTPFPLRSSLPGAHVAARLHRAWARASLRIRVAVRAGALGAAVALALPVAQAQPQPVPPPPTPATQAGGAPLATPAAVEKVLANGLKLVVIEDRRAPTVIHMAWYRAGSLDEVNGRTGVAHVLEHLMFKATKTMAAGEFSKRVAQMGGRENAFTNRDYTGYYQQVPKAGLPQVMAMEADRMANLVLSKEEFEKEIKVVMEERRWRTEDRAGGLMYEQLMANAFVASPTRTPVVGWMNDLEQMTHEDARDWYERWYAPNNAVVVVVGDVTADEVIALAERTYGKVARKPLPVRKPQVEPEQKGVRRVSVKAPAENPSVLMGFRVPKLVTIDGDREPYALEVLSAVLSGDENGRFTRDIVRGSRVANQAGAGYDMTARGPILFLLSGTPAEGRTTADVEQAMRAQIQRIADEGVREDELKRVKTQYVAGQIFARDSIMAQAMEVGGLEMTGFTRADADRILDRVRTVTSAEVQAVAKKYFGDDQLTVVTLLPQPMGEQRRAPPAGLRHQ